MDKIVLARPAQLGMNDTIVFRRILESTSFHVWVYSECLGYEVRVGTIYDTLSSNPLLSVELIGIRLISDIIQLWRENKELFNDST